MSNAAGTFQPCLTLPCHSKTVSSNWKQLQGSGLLKRSGREKKAEPQPKKGGRRKVKSTNERIKSEERSQSGSTEKELTNVLSLDCEFVGAGLNGHEDMLARVAIVNAKLQCVYDKFVRPSKAVTDYRTAVSGVRPADVANAEPFAAVQREVAAMLDGRVLVGHGVKKDLKVLGLSHRRKFIRDTSSYPLFRKMVRRHTPSLKHLAAAILGIEIQHGEHDPVQDAQAAMQLYLTHRVDWDLSRAGKRTRRRMRAGAN